MTTISPARTVRDGRGAVRTLGREIGSGGEGTVYLVDDDPTLVAKLYAQRPAPDQVAKLEAMVATGDEMLRRVAAWPSDLAYDADGAVGFFMPKLASQLPLHELFGPRRRQELFPEAHWTFLVHAALNVARAFEAMHERGIVVGDVNSNNVVIHHTSKTRFIDCDSFQLERDGRRFRCNVGVPEYQPPELQAVDLAQAERLPEHDRFGLAVMVFQLLFVGRHPFAGVLPPHLTGDASIGANVAARYFFYGPEAARIGLRPPPGSLALTALPDAIETLFMRAFLGEPAERPTASEWRVALRDLESTTATCERSRRHRYVRGVACPWCELERGGLYFFVPRPEEAPKLDDSAWLRAPDAEIERMWAEIAALPAPPPAPDPIVTRPAARRRPLLAARAYLGRTLNRRPDTAAIVAERRAELERARAAFRASYARWRLLASGAPFAAERAALDALRRRLLGQRAQRDAELAIARNAQYQLDAATFLAQFPIPRVPQVQGSLVTPSGPTTGIENRQIRDLAQHGITNAANCTVAALRAVPHLRSWRFDVLVEWRMALEAQFAALPVRELDYKVRHEIEMRHARERENGATELRDGIERLRRLSADITRELEELNERLPHEAEALRRAQEAFTVAPLDVPD